MSDEVASQNLRGRKLGMLLSTGPAHPNLETGLGLARAALDRGVDLYLYLVDDGVRNIDDERVLELGARGAQALRVRLRLPAAPSAHHGQGHVLRSGRAHRSHQRHRSLRRAQLTPARTCRSARDRDDRDREPGPRRRLRGPARPPTARTRPCASRSASSRERTPSSSRYRRRREGPRRGHRRPTSTGTISRTCATLKKLGLAFHVERSAHAVRRRLEPAGLDLLPIDRAELADLLARQPSGPALLDGHAARPAPRQGSRKRHRARGDPRPGGQAGARSRSC